MSLEELRRAVVNKDPGAKNRLARSLQSHLRQHYKAADAEEIIQDSITEIWATLHTFEPVDPDAFRRWVMVIAKRRAIRLRQRMRREVSTDTLLNARADPGASPSQWTLMRERARDVEGQLSKLPTIFFRALKHLLSGGGGKSLAEAEGIPAPTAYTRVHLTRKRLRSLLRAKLGKAVIAASS